MRTPVSWLRHAWLCRKYQRVTKYALKQNAFKDTATERNRACAWLGNESCWRDYSVTSSELLGGIHKSLVTQHTSSAAPKPQTSNFPPQHTSTAEHSKASESWIETTREPVERTAQKNPVVDSVADEDRATVDGVGKRSAHARRR